MLIIDLLNWLSTIYKAVIIPLFYLLQLFSSNFLSRTQVDNILNTIHINCTRTIVTLFFCLCISVLNVQKEAAPKTRHVFFGHQPFRLQLLKTSKGFFSWLCYEPKGPFKPCNTSLGFQVNYWRNLIPHIYISGNLGGDFSNFPAFFVKGDSIESCNHLQASFV